MSLRAVSGSLTISLILRPDEGRRRLVRLRVGGDVAERAEHEPEAVALVPVLLEDPLRSSSETLIASTPLSWKPKATTELRTCSQIASKFSLVSATSAGSIGPLPDGTQYCGERWKTVRWPATAWRRRR